MGSGRIIHGDTDWSRFDDCRRLAVAGRQFHQDALLAACHRKVTDSNRYECTAELRREPGNPHDAKAILVLIEGYAVGYLKRGTAKRLNARLKVLEDKGKRTTSVAFIRLDNEGELQAHLQVPYASDLLKGHKNPNGKR